MDTTPGKQLLTSDEKRTRARMLRAKRKARRQAAEESWKAQVAAHFGFLETAYGFHFAKVDGSSWWQTTVRYDAALLAVRIDKSVEFERVEVWLIRLVDGQLPKYPIFINPETPINYVILDRVLHNRGPQEAEKLAGLKGLTDDRVEGSLIFLANALRTYCDDVLRGDFALFEIIAEQIHQQAREHPQGIRIIVPDTTSHEDTLARVEESHRAFPQQPVTVEYYTTKKRRSRRSRRKDKHDSSQGSATP